MPPDALENMLQGGFGASSPETHSLILALQGKDRAKSVAMVLYLSSPCMMRMRPSGCTALRAWGSVKLLGSGIRKPTPKHSSRILYLDVPSGLSGERMKAV